MSPVEATDLSLSLEALRRMALIRLVEMYIARRYGEGTMRCPTHLCVGQESVAGAFGVFARRDDAFFGNYRSHGHFLAKGGSLLELFAELLGRAGGCSGGLGGSMHLVDLSCGFFGSSAIVASTVPLAAGVALSFRRRGAAQVAVVFFGDAALEAGVVYETVNFALLYKLPLILVCENNDLAISTPLELRTASPALHRRFESMGLAGVRVDGCDVGGLMAAARRAFETARSGGGPTFVECMVSRWAAHVGPAVIGPVDAWWQEPRSAEGTCPIARLVSGLVAGGHISLAEVRSMRDEMQDLVERTFAEASRLPLAALENLDDVVFASGLLSALPKSTRGPVGVEGRAYREPSKLVNPF